MIGHDQSNGEGVLAGYKVVELGVWIAAPAAAGVLADWGAEVVKVESRSGDPQRSFFNAVGMSSKRAPFFELDNRGKRSVALDLKDPEDLAVLEGLLEEADVFVTNLRPRALESLGLDPEHVRERLPGLVYAQITGYGSDGPDRNRASYDVGAFWSRSGLADRMTIRGEAPPTIPAAFGDHITAMNLVAGISAALAARERTGRGRLVETSLFRTGIYCLASDLATQLCFDKCATIPPRTKSGAPLQNSYPTQDGRWFWLLCLESDRHWPKLKRALGSPDWAEDERFADARARLANRRELIALLDERFSEHTLAEWTERFEAEEVWYAPVSRLDELVDDPQAHAARAFVEIPASGELDALRSPASPVDFDRERCRPRRACPTVGEHTEEVRKELAARAPAPGPDRSGGA